MPLTKRSRKTLEIKVFLLFFLMIEGSGSTRLKNIRIQIRSTAYKFAELIDLDYNPAVQANLGGVCGGPRGERTCRGAGTQRGLFCQVGQQLGLMVGTSWGLRVGISWGSG
jgi:hypothetical protein